MAIAIYRMIKKRNSPQTSPTKPKASPACSHRTSPLSRQRSPDSTPSSSHETKPATCTQCQTEKSAARKYRYKLIFSLTPAFFLSSLDFTIVATALPFIASHFDKLNQLNWIVTAFTLTSTAFIPIYGQLADTFGRHATIQLAVTLLTIGSVLCAAAPAWGVLLLGRALQGIGTAGVQNTVMIVLADSVSLKEQAVTTSIFQFVNGIGYAVGPVIGGYLTNADWRYCFVLCAGVGVVSSVSVFFFLRSVLKKGTISVMHPDPGQTRLRNLISGLASLDFGGICFFILGVGLIILGTAWGGSTYPWSSAAVLVSIVLGLVFLITFIAYEYFLEPGHYLQRRFPGIKPLIPFSLLKNKDISLICIISAATGAAIYSVFYFIGIYFTLVEAYPASKAGLQLLYYVPGIGIGVYTAVYLCNVAPRQTFWPLFLGTIIETTGLAVVTWAVKSRNSTVVNVMMGVAGGGTGARFMPMNLHFSGMFYDKLASAYSLLRFSLPFGGTLALTIMGSVFQNKMAGVFGDSGVNGGSSSVGFDTHTDAGLNAVNQLSPAAQAAVRSTAADATMWAFISILPFLAIGMFASMGLGNVWISPKTKTPQADESVLTTGEIPMMNTEEEHVDGPEKAQEKSTAEGVHPLPSQSTTVRSAIPSDSKTQGTDRGGLVYDGVYLLGLFQGTVRDGRRPTAKPASRG